MVRKIFGYHLGQKQVHSGERRRAQRLPPARTDGCYLLFCRALSQKRGVRGTHADPRRQPSFGEYGRPGAGGRPFGDPDREHAQMGLVAPYAAPRNGADSRFRREGAGDLPRGGAAAGHVVCRRTVVEPRADEPSARIYRQTEHSRSVARNGALRARRHEFQPLPRTIPPHFPVRHDEVHGDLQRFRGLFRYSGRSFS